MKTNKTFQKSLGSPLAQAVSLSRQGTRPSLYLKARGRESKRQRERESAETRWSLLGGGGVGGEGSWQVKESPVTRAGSFMLSGSPPWLDDGHICSVRSLQAPPGYWALTLNLLCCWACLISGGCLSVSASGFTVWWFSWRGEQGVWGQRSSGEQPGKGWIGMGGGIGQTVCRGLDRVLWLVEEEERGDVGGGLAVSQGGSTRQAQRHSQCH